MKLELGLVALGAATAEVALTTIASDLWNGVFCVAIGIFIVGFVVGTGNLPLTASR